MKRKIIVCVKIAFKGQSEDVLRTWTERHSVSTRANKEKTFPYLTRPRPSEKWHNRGCKKSQGAVSRRNRHLSVCDNHNLYQANGPWQSGKKCDCSEESYYNRGSKISYYVSLASEECCRRQKPFHIVLFNVTVMPICMAMPKTPHKLRSTVLHTRWGSSIILDWSRCFTPHQPRS